MVAVSPARLPRNNQKLLFEPPALTFKDEPSDVEKTKLNEVFSDNFDSLYGPRHDEFDWSLAKVSRKICF